MTLIKEMKRSEVIFREYDLRGTEKEGLDGSFAYRLGLAYGFYLKEKTKRESLKVSVGHDARLNSPSLFQNLVKGLRKQGIRVYDLGICPTPLLYFSLFNLRVDGGIMITGSHNPPEYNGFKISLGKETISGREIQKLKEAFHRVGQEKKSSSELLAPVERVDIINQYLTFLEKKFAHLKELPEIKICVDSGNGTAGLVAPYILRKIGCQVIDLFSEPDGNFPNHHPDPTILTNLKFLQKTVVNEKCDFGIAFDGDADRLGAVDEKGKVVYGDKLLALFAREVLKKNPKAKIIAEVKCSHLLYEIIKDLGGQPIMWKTGHSLIKKKMQEEKALLAGEMSGHFFFADQYFGFDDAIYSSLRLAEILKEAREKNPNVKFSQLYADFPPTVCTPEIRVDCPEKVKNLLVEIIKEKLLKHKKESLKPKIIDLNFIDGVRFNFENGWGLVRASNTQGALVLRFEANNRKQLKEYQVLIEKYLKEVEK